jgi:hypothetical protein
MVSSRSVYVSPTNNVSKSAAWAQNATSIVPPKRSLSPTINNSVDSSYVDSKPIEVSLAELRNVRRNMKKQRLNGNGRNKDSSIITNSTKKKAFNSEASRMSSNVGLTDEQIWINHQVEHLFKVRRNKNWYFI